MKRNLILLVLCLLIGGYYYLDTQNQEKQQAQEDLEKQLVTFEQDDIKEVAIVSADETKKAVRNENAWRLVEPFDTSADKNNWDNVVSQFTSGESQRVVREDAEDLSPYGLDEPKFEIILATENSEESTTVKIGKETPTAGKYYATINDTNDILTILASMHTAVDKSLFDFRDKNVYTFANEDVQKIDVKHEGLDATFERNGEEWIVTKPINVRADESKITNIMNAVKNSRIKLFVEEVPDSYEGYGLIDPATKIVLWTSEEGNEAGLSSRALLLGASSSTEDHYAMREGQKNVFTLNPSDFANVPIGLEELRITKVTPISSWEIERFSIESAGSMILSVSKNGGEWVMVEPNQGNAMFADVSGLTRDITGLEPSRFVVGTKDEFITDAAFSIHIETKEDSDTITLSGPKTYEGESYYFGAFDEPLEIFALPENIMNDIVSNARNVQLDLPEEVDVETDLLAPNIE